ncbi:helix-turn-helix transcriptional regulator [Fictibacillus nanhaiensis]|uniref:helix-turn-helix domain-containing protein n=1 Tax=Fictibacillus nanhaiensis TaxID=742169 RepID=UPI002E207283|nr:helix-turn-helix transcriptional regulator [Fictibacillus nanhaiensis]
MKAIIGRCLLQDLLDSRGWTQLQLADKTGIAKSQISDYTRGTRKMSFSTAYLIAFVLKCDMSDLYSMTIK